MPGLSFVYDFNKNIHKRKSLILKALDSLLFTKKYTRKILLNKDSCILGCTKYEEYPLIHLENDKNSIYLEGKIYGKDNYTIKKELNELSKLIFNDYNNNKNQIIDWLLNTDGEFIIFILNKKKGEIAILNDALGHLPLYYYQSKGKIYVSREIRFISNLLDDINFDKMSIAQYLLFRHPLGKRTLLEKIYRLKPGSLIRINLAKFEILIDNIHEFNFMRKKYSQRGLKENVENMTSLLIETCNNMATSEKEFKNILNLSGGLDSRVVAVGLKKSNIQFNGVTHLDHRNIAKIDADVAEQLAKLLDINWSLFQLDPPKGKDYLKLLKIKGGLNYLTMSMIMPFYQKLLDVYGPRIINFTGDTGLALRDVYPSKKLRDLDDLVSYILYKHAHFELDDVADLVGIEKCEILNELKNHLKSYPEDDMRQKYVHFIIYERDFYWQYEGMDRNRFFCWVAAPLESTKFFNYIINCPDKQKKNYRFYQEILLKFSPQTAYINYANYKMPITSKKIRFKFFKESNYEKIPLSLKKRIRKYSSKKYLDSSTNYSTNSNIVKCLSDQLSNCKSIHKYLSYSKIENIIKYCSKQQLELLFTITSSIEEFRCEQSSLNKYLECKFTYQLKKNSLK